VTRRRLDTELVRRGLVSSRSEAQEAVRAGLVTVGGAPASKTAMMVAVDEPVRLAARPRAFVSRAGGKLASALERFGISVEGRSCLDAGASTGGFTDCLLQAGAATVVAVDVGYGQLAWHLRRDPRVVVMERTNVRELGPRDVPGRPTLVVADLSFISLRQVLPSLVRVADPNAELVVLVKPQFEAGRSDVGRGGVVKDPEVWRRVLHDVIHAAAAEGLVARGAMASPLPGPAGNVEFLVHLAHEGADAADVEAAIREGREVQP
jgi:23S rRNA (cytidine1920-2'-O)/16S rRNA (cytidine1409-2'-O)-methyltransferase